MTSSAKETNPKDAIGIRKAPMSVLPGPVLMDMALGLLEGALKYRRHNYRVAGIRASVYFDAAMRHLWAWWEGQDIDPDSGLHHVTKALSCLAVLRDAQLQCMCTDDRPPSHLDERWVVWANAQAARLLDAHPTHQPPYTRADWTPTAPTAPTERPMPGPPAPTAAAPHDTGDLDPWREPTDLHAKCSRCGSTGEASECLHLMGDLHEPPQWLCTGCFRGA